MNKRPIIKAIYCLVVASINMVVVAVSCLGIRDPNQVVDVVCSKRVSDQVFETVSKLVEVLITECREKGYVQKGKDTGS